MAIKTEFNTESTPPKNLEQNVSNILGVVPREHLRGIERIRFVEAINDPRIKVPQSTKLPGLYHPRQGTQPAWLEISLEALLPAKQPLQKRLLSRLAFKSNLASLIYSLVGQHYYLTLRHSIKRGQIEPAIRAYTEKYLKVWGSNQSNWRTRLFKPLQPTFERWSKSLQKQIQKEKKRKG
jgi:hypothetical protein